MENEKGDSQGWPGIRQTFGEKISTNGAVADDRAWRQRRLDHDGFGRPQRVIGGLEVAVIEKRELHRRIGGKRPLEQGAHGGARRGPAARPSRSVGGPRPR